MAYTSAQFAVAGTAVSVTPAPVAGETVLVKAVSYPVWIGPAGVTTATGFLLEPADGPIQITDVAGADELFAIATAEQPARVHTLRRPIA